MDWTERLRRKFGRYAIPHLMYYIAGGMLLLFLMSFALPGVVWRWFPLDMASVLHGQVWRLVTFVFLPPSTSLLFAIFSIYFYYFIGSSLESYWGSFRFNLFYLTGWIGTILGALITGYAVNTYLNFSLFLAFAMLAPDYQVTLFFFFPIKIKYLAILDAIGFLIAFIFGSWSTRIAIVISLLNVILFFGGSFLKNYRYQRQFRETRKNFRKFYKNK